MSTCYKNYYGSGYSTCYDYHYQTSCYSKNYAPTAKSDCISTAEDKPLKISPSTLLSNDTDANGDNLTLVSVQNPTHGTVAIVNGYVVFTPAANYYGPATFSYTISDGKGGTSSATVNVNVRSVNDVPDAVNDSITVTTPDNVVIDPATLLANDTDADGDKLTITSVQCATNGTVALVNGQIIFTPNAGYSGPATFTYTISDGKGGCGSASSDTATVCLTIKAVNTAPDAVNDGVIAGDEDTAFVINVATLLANDTDANGDNLTIISVQDSTNGTVALVNGQVTFTPTANYNGPASFTYTISDGKGGTDTATVSLNIYSVNDAPMATDDGVILGNENAALEIATATLLANDTDIEGNTLTITSVQDAINGTVVLVNGKVVFTPNANYSGLATFTYTISDGNGGLSTATVHLDIVPAPQTLTVASSTSSLSEEGLLGGLQDTTGNPDTTNVTMATGDIQISNAVGNVIVTLAQPTQALTSGGVAVIWQGDGGQQLTAIAGAKVVATVNIDNFGHYTVNLLQAIDHNGVNVEDVKTLNFAVSVADSLTSANAVLAVNIEDDAPVVTNQSNSIAAIDTNLLITLDISGSMAEASGINGLTRMQSAVQSIQQLLNTYDSFGDIRVRLVTLSDNATTLGSEWVTLDVAKNMLNNLVVTGTYTNYDGALANAMSAFADTGKIAGAQNISYFFSDGAPNRGDGNDSLLSNAGSVFERTGITNNEEAIWKSFLVENQVKSFAIGMGQDLTNVNLLNPIAYDGQAQTDIGGVIVSQFADLNNALAETINTLTAGQLLSGGLLGPNNGVGADGGFVKSVTIENVTYTYDALTTTVTNNANIAMQFDAITKKLSVTLTSGGSFVVDMDDGSYQYYTPAVVSSAVVERFDYVITDKDGDTAAASITLDVEKSNVTVGTQASDTLIGVASPDVLLGREGDDLISGGAGRDVLLGGDGNDTLAGGAGNDILAGGLGADTFVWALADTSALGIEADKITDFSATDALNLKDLLVGESATADALDNYLHFNFTSSDTIVSISSTGGFVDNNATGQPNAAVLANTDQQIVFAGVDLTAGFMSDAQVIQNLLNQQKLITD